MALRLSSHELNLAFTRRAMEQLRGFVELSKPTFPCLGKELPDKPEEGANEGNPRL